MGIKKQFMVLYTILIALFGNSVLLYNSLTELKRIQNIRYNSKLLADELRQGIDDLTRFARTYVVMNDVIYKQMYEEILAIRDGKKPRPVGYEKVYWDLHAVTKIIPDVKKGEGVIVESIESRMKKIGFTKEELHQLTLAKQRSKKLVEIEKIAMDAVNDIISEENATKILPAETNRDYGIRIMHDGMYHRLKGSIMEAINKFFSLIDARTSSDVQKIEEQVSLFFWSIIALIVAMSVAIAFRSETLALHAEQQT